MRMIDRIDETEAAFLATLREQRTFITGDGRVTEDVAARLLGYQAKTLRNWRAAGQGPVSYRGARTTYRLRELAEWIESRRADAEIASLDVLAHHAVSRSDIDD